MDELKGKAEEIYLVLAEPEVDLWKLRELALTEGGLVNDAIRKQAWPKLVGLHGTFEDEDLKRLRRVLPLPSGTSLSDLNQNHELQVPVSDRDEASHVFTEPTSNYPKSSSAECLDSDQINRDVARCTWHLLAGSQRSRRHQFEKKHRKRISSALRRKQHRLSNLIKLTLLRSYGEMDAVDDRLRYYQGYHDVASIFLAVLGGGVRRRGNVSPNTDSEPIDSIVASLGLDLPSMVLGQVSHSHFRDAMKSSFVQLQAVLRLVLFPLIAAFDPEVHSYLLYCDMEPFFAISWVITWFSHDIRDTELVKRLFDAFIVSHPLFSLYLAVAMILHPVNRMQVLTTECDFACVHQTLMNLPSNSCMESWNYRWSDVSISNDDEEGTLSTDLDGSYVSDDFIVVDGHDDELSESDSFLSVGPLNPPARVPFQDLIDTAISYMRRIPPRKILSLAKRYYAEESVKPLLIEIPSIQLFRNPPAWALASKAKADWVLKQRGRERLGLPSRSRKDRRKRASAQNDTVVNGLHIVHAETDDEIKTFLKEKSRNLAVIASGFGPGDEYRCRFRRRAVASIAVAVLAVSCALLLRYRSKHVSPSTHGDNEICGRTETASVASCGQCDLLSQPASAVFATTSAGKDAVTQTSTVARINAKQTSGAVGATIVSLSGHPISELGGSRKNILHKGSTTHEGPWGTLRGWTVRAQKSTVLVDSASGSFRKAEPFKNEHGAIMPSTRNGVLPLQQWTILKENYLLWAKPTRRALERKVTDLVRTTRESLLSLQLGSLRERSLLFAQEIYLVVQRKIKNFRLTKRSTSVLHALELINSQDQVRKVVRIKPPWWFGMPKHFLVVSHAVSKFAKKTVKDICRAIVEHDADVLDNLS